MKISYSAPLNEIASIRLKATTLLVVLMVVTGFFSESLEQILAHRLFDAYQKLMPRQRVSAPVVIVDIDETSLKIHGQWPWPRTIVSRLLDAVNAGRPAAVGIDIIFAEADRFAPERLPEALPNIQPSLMKALVTMPSPDKSLAAVLKKGPFVLGMAGLEDGNNQTPFGLMPFRARGGDPSPYLRNYRGVLSSIGIINEAAPGRGLLSIDIEDGIARRVPLLAAIGETPAPALGLALLNMAAKVNLLDIHVEKNGIAGVGIGDLFIPTTQDGRIWVHFGVRDSNRYVSAAEALAGRTASDAFTDKIVLVGFTGLGLLDFITVPTGERMPGIEAHAQLLENIFDNSWLSRPALLRKGELIIFGLLSLILALATPAVRPGQSLLIWGVMTIVLMAAGILLFRAGILFDALGPTLGTTFVYGATLAMTLLRTERSRRELQKALAAEREATARLEGEMAAARSVQLGMLPSTAALPADVRFDLAVFMKPARQVGGDLYDFFPLGKDRLFFLIGDVSGKGMPASLFMALSKALCKSVALRGGDDRTVAPDEIITQTNIEAARDNPEMNFVTAVAGELDLKSGEVTWSTAGHDEPIHIIRGERRVEQWTSNNGPPLCVIEDIHYNRAKGRLSPGDTLVLFTDGITEAQDIHGGFYGLDRLKECLSGLTDGASAQFIMECLLADVQDFVGNAEQADDMTILAIRWLGNREPSINSP